MSAYHPTPWQAQLSKAIVDFPVWGRLRPSSARGHAITALAFYDWSQGGLGIAVCESPVKSIGSYLYACAFSAERFEAVFVDWKEGWCSDARQSSHRFTEDAGGGETVYSYSHGALDAQGIQEQRNALSPQDQVLVHALKMHLDDALGVFDWAVWLDTAAVLRKVDSFVQPVALKAGRYLLPIRDPHHPEQVWPSEFSSDELCSYLGSTARENGAIDFFAFQERMDRYLLENPECQWDASHSARLLTLLAKDKGNRNTYASYFFSVWEHDRTWPAPSTRVVGPLFSEYVSSFVGTMQYADKDQLDTAWIAASHFVPDAKLFDMFDTVFQGKEQLDGSDELHLGETMFRLVGTRGERGRLMRMESSNSLDLSSLDALRQARAWCGGILSVDANLVERAPHFWKTRFERREVAALLDKSGDALCAHPHFYYNKTPIDVPHSMTMRNDHSFVEYSLFQENSRMWRGRVGGTLEGPWGWKKCLDQQAIKPVWPLTFPTTDRGEFEDSSRWQEMRDRWLHTMGPGEAAAVYSILRNSPSWPIKDVEYKELAEYYLGSDPTLFALCEMMDFDAAGVLTALRTASCGLDLSNAPEVVSQELGSLLDNVE